MKRLSILAVAGVLVLPAAALADENVDKVVDRMSEGDVAAICQGGRDSIRAAAKEATTSLAQSGSISGDFSEIGKAAGRTFYEQKCT